VRKVDTETLYKMKAGGVRAREREGEKETKLQKTKNIFVLLEFYAFFLTNKKIMINKKRKS